MVAGGAIALGVGGWIWHKIASDSSNNSAHKSKNENSGKAAEGDPNSNLPKNTKEINITKHVAKDMEERGWTRESIQNTVDDPYTTRVSKVYWNDNPATAYYNQDGSYVVIEDSTGNTVQISNRFDPYWEPDFNIIDPYIP